MEQSKKKEQGSTAPRQMMNIMPRSYIALLAGIVLILGFLLGWAFFGTLSKTVTVTGLYHPVDGMGGEILAFVPISTGKMLEEGMEASIILSGFDYQRYGHMEAEVVYVDKDLTTVEEMRRLLPDDSIISPFLQVGPVIEVCLRLTKDEDSQNGYYWSGSEGGDLRIYDLTFASVMITLQKVRPISLGIPELEEVLGM